MNNQNINEAIKAINIVLLSKSSLLSDLDKEILLKAKLEIENSQSNTDLIGPIIALAKVMNILYDFTKHLT